ncbi:MAG TPA: XdhC family protein, partial [Longimicrobiales bacterium]|nr:XdhC family protein [Longimicrobiales bacterium]
MDVYRRAAELRSLGTPHLLATVVWRRGPSSGRMGAHALIHSDGVMEGWIGGACAEPTVLDEAMEALHDGRPRLLVLGELDRRAGVSNVAMACESEGAMEVYLEPYVPPPRVVVIGGSPMAETLVRLAADLGWRATLIDDRGKPAGHPGLDDVRITLDLDDV